MFAMYNYCNRLIRMTGSGGGGGGGMSPPATPGFYGPM